MVSPVSAAYAIRGASVPAIVASVEEGIAVGALRPGHSLPSVRGLAAQLGVSPTTVAAAYRLLHRRGATRAVARSRTVVAPRAGLPLRAMGQVADGLVDLGRGGPDPALLPDLAAAFRVSGPSVGYGESPVVTELAAAIAARCCAAGIDGSATTVVNGGMDGVERVLAAALLPGDAVAVEDPGYPAVHDLARVLGLRLLPVGLDDEGPLPDDVAAAVAGGARALVLTPRGQNPTGAALTDARAETLRTVLDRSPGLLVVEDDHLGAVGERPGGTLTAGRQRWAWVSSVAKALGPDLRLAAVAGDPATVGAVEARLALGPGWVSTVTQRAVAHLEADPRLPDLLARARRAYRVRREALRDALATRGVPSAGASGLNVWVPVRSEAPVVAALARSGWAVRPGDVFRLASAPGVRITTAALPEAEAEAVADAVAGALRPVRRTRGA